MKVLWIIVSLIVSAAVAEDEIPQEFLDKEFKLGGIFYEDATDMQNAFQISTKKFGFKPVMKTVLRGDIIEVGRKVCEIAEDQIVGMIDGTRGRSSEHVQSVCDMLEVPHVVVQHNDLHATNWSQLNLYPSSDAYNMVLEEILLHKEWTNFTILYVKGHNLGKVSRLLRMGNETDKATVTVRELTGNDYRDVLIQAKHSGFVNFVVDCPSENLDLFLNHSQQVGLMADEHSYVFLSPDLFTIDLSKYRYGGVNMTGFRLLDLKQNKDMWDYTADFNAETGYTLEPEAIKTEIVLIYDAVKVFYKGLQKVNVTAEKYGCEDYSSWPYGSTLINFMRTNQIVGITRTLNFDGFGQRTNVIMEILELTPAGNQTIGFWKDSKLEMSRPVVPSAEITGESIMKNKTFKVLISTAEPFGFIKESQIELKGNDQYEGFTVDLIDRLSDILEFSYEFEVENTYGNYDSKTDSYNGMVRKIMDEIADFGICDFTITAERQAAIDFSIPFMTVGIGILYKEPSKQPPEMFSFMAVFSNEVWLYMLLVQAGLGVIMIFVGRISHKEWQNPVPCIEQPEEFTNQFSFANSIWLIIGSVMQQGSEIAPIALAPRMITSVWWFFTMVIVASYTGTLVAFLTVEKNVLPFKNVEELYEHKSISYGAKATGSTKSFFESSKKPMYKDMYKKMFEKGWLVGGNEIGVKKAEDENYAFFMESASIEYFKERHCDLLQIGDLLDSKSYGIGMKKGSEYKKYIDEALLVMKETGQIQELKDLWWKEKRGGGRCGEKTNEEQKELGMKNMLGAFVVLGVGCCIGLLISILDMLWGVFKRSVKYNKGQLILDPDHLPILQYGFGYMNESHLIYAGNDETTFQYELIEELKFALKFSGDVKPVRRPRKEGSSEALADHDGEAKDEIRSLKSIGSSCTHRTHHSHSSRHSSRSQSVAFARMREYN